MSYIPYKSYFVNNKGIDKSKKLYFYIIKFTRYEHMYLLMTICAALSFAVGGIFMKLSDGFNNLMASILIYIFFILGASLQTIAMREAELGITYIFVLGLECVIAFLFGVFIFKEAQSFGKLVGVAAIVAGIILLRTGD